MAEHPGSALELPPQDGQTWADPFLFVKKNRHTFFFAKTKSIGRPTVDPWRKKWLPLLVIVKFCIALSKTAFFRDLHSVLVQLNTRRMDSASCGCIPASQVNSNDSSSLFFLWNLF